MIIMEADEFQRKLYNLFSYGYLYKDYRKDFAKYVSDNILPEGKELKKEDVDISKLRYEVAKKIDILQCKKEDMPKLDDMKNYFLNLYENLPQIKKEENHLKTEINNINDIKNAAEAIKMGKRTSTSCL